MVGYLYFFIHEYKKEVEATGDPLGQLLIVMVGAQRGNARHGNARHGNAQQQNEEALPMYGCYVLGRNWFFVVLKEHQYAVSIAFDATQEDIFRIYSVLEEIKIRTAA